MPRELARDLRQGGGGVEGKGRHLVAEKAATFHPEADIGTAVEAVRAREGQLPEITLGGGEWEKKDTLRAGGDKGE